MMKLTKTYLQDLIRKELNELAGPSPLEKFKDVKKRASAAPASGQKRSPSRSPPKETGTHTITKAVGPAKQAGAIKAASNIISQNTKLVKAVIKRHKELKKGNLQYSDLVGIFKQKGINLPKLPGNANIGLDKGQPKISLSKKVGDVTLTGGVKSDVPGAGDIKSEFFGALGTEYSAKATTGKDGWTASGTYKPGDAKTKASGTGRLKTGGFEASGTFGRGSPTGKISTKGKISPNLAYDAGIDVMGGRDPSVTGARGSLAYQKGRFGARGGVEYGRDTGVKGKGALSYRLGDDVVATATGEASEDEYKAGIGIGGRFEESRRRKIHIKIIKG